MNKRGRKRLTEEQKVAYLKWQNERVKIANLIARKANIAKTCCICNKPGKILHNRQDPYYIAFICDECKKIPANLEYAEENRFDLRTILDRNNLGTVHFSDEEITRFVIGYMNENLSLGDYCNEHKISRYQFNQFINKYNQIFPEQNIKTLIKTHSKKIQGEHIKKLNSSK